MGRRRTAMQMRKPRAKSLSVVYRGVRQDQRETTRSLHGPHKIFLWNAQGVYLDCAFPNPVYGHFFGGAKVRGAHLADFFSHDSSQHILKALTETLTLQVGKNVAVEIERKGTAYLATIQLFPMDRHILGWVKDHPVSPRTVVPEAEAPLCFPTGFCSPEVQLTPKEQQVVNAFGPGHSNRHIAEVLQMTERTVRFHISNLLHKLHLPSRAHLAHLRLDESCSPNPK